MSRLPRSGAALVMAVLLTLVAGLVGAGTARAQPAELAYLDSTGAASMPRGGVETGLGGTVTGPVIGFGAGLLALVAAGFAVRLRGRHR